MIDVIIGDRGRRLAGRLLAAGVTALSVAACAAFPEGESTCADRGSGEASWPYCAPSEPGGHSPADFPDPTRG